MSHFWPVYHVCDSDQLVLYRFMTKISYQWLLIRPRFLGSPVIGRGSLQLPQAPHQPGCSGQSLSREAEAEASPQSCGASPWRPWRWLLGGGFLKGKICVPCVSSCSSLKLRGPCGCAPQDAMIPHVFSRR